MVLVMSAVELIFFMLTDMGLHFRFVLLITHGCFHFYWAALRVEAFSACGDTGGAQGSARWHRQSCWLPLIKRDISDHLVSCSAPRAGERRRKGDFWSDCICVPKSPLLMMRPSSPGDGWTPACPWEAVKEFLVLLCTCAEFCFVYETIFISIHKVFFLLIFWFFLIPPVEERASGSMGQRCQLGWNHNKRVPQLLAH